jgi:LmbE family N-acetylglucosaminyl deacetylase
MSVEENSSPKRALIICAHDDDEVIGPGGTIRKLANAGVEVTTVIFATGNEGYLSLADKDTIVQRRAKEAQKAASCLGTKAHITYGYDDFSNLDCNDVYRKVLHAVRTAKPHIVFSHLPTDYIAHRTLSSVVPEAVWQSGWNCSLEFGQPWAVDKLYLFPILELVPKPSHIVDITDTFAAKIEAMKAYDSQHEVVPRILDQIEAKARVYGSLIGVKYGEAFMKSQAIPIHIRHADDLLGSMA